MWSLLPRKLQLTLIIGVGLLFAWSYDAVVAAITGHESGLIPTISLTATVLGGLLTLALELSWKWLWRRWPFIQAHTFPDLNGTWTGSLVSTWTNPETGQRPEPIETTVIIRQGLFVTTIALVTGESKSYSTRVFLEPFYERRCYRIWYSYSNTPQAEYQNRSSPHEGVSFLEVDYGVDCNHLTGSYYTARKTTGDLSLRRAQPGP